MSRVYLTPEQIAARRFPCERSFTHRLTPQTDETTVFATNFSRNGAKVADLSGNGNDGTISGAVRAGGYFRDVMRYDGVNDRVIVGGMTNFTPTNGFSAECLLCADNISDGSYALHQVNDGLNTEAHGISYYGGNIRAVIQRNDIWYVLDTPSTVGKIEHLIFTYDNATFRMYLNGSLIDDMEIPDGALPTMDSELSVGSLAYVPDMHFGGTILLASVFDTPLAATIPKARFNSLATLPLYHIDFSRYPSNTTVYSGNIPYSSMRVESGSFKIDGSQLVCVTDGTITMRNAHNFDGAEYITLTIDGSKASDTGSVTAGTTSASITQGSSLITVAMAAGDVLDSLHIQFREPVA